MGINISLLKYKMAKMQLSHSEMAQKLGIDASTFYRKLQSNGENFTVGQMHKIVEALNLSGDEARSIFLWNNSQKCENTETAS